MEPNTFLELEGIPQNKNSFRVYNYSKFAPELTENFDTELYNEIIKVQAAAFDNNQFLIKDVREHFGGSCNEDVQLLSKPTTFSGGQNSEAAYM